MELFPAGRLDTLHGQALQKQRRPDLKVPRLAIDPFETIHHPLQMDNFKQPLFYEINIADEIFVVRTGRFCFR